MQNNLTENLKVWRDDRNIKNRDTKVFIANVLEELLEIVFVDKNAIDTFKNEIMQEYFSYNARSDKTTIDAIKDIKVLCVNETELMGYCDIKTDDEVFKEINSRIQDPQQKEEWKLKGAYGKWKKSELENDKKNWYKANYSICKLLT